MKKLLYAFLIAAVAAVHSGCKDDEETFVHVEKVSIDVRELHLNPGKTYQAFGHDRTGGRHQPENRLVQAQYQRGHRRQERSGHGAGFRRSDTHGRSQRHARQRRDPSHDRRRGQQHSHRKPDARRHVQDIRLRGRSGCRSLPVRPGDPAGERHEQKGSSGPPTIRSSPESTTTECWFPYRTAKRPSASRPPTAEIKPPGAK